MRNRTTIAALMAGLTLGFAAHAAEPVTPQAETFSQSSTVAIDPATGQLRAPTAVEMQALKAKQAQMRIGAGSKMPRNEAEAIKTQRTLRGGGVRIAVPESLMSSVVATRQADGSIRIGHADENGSVSTTEQENSK